MDKDKLLQFINDQLAEIVSLDLASDMESIYYMGAVHAFQCVKSYITEKKPSGMMTAACVLQSPKENLHELEKGNGK